MTKVYRIFIYRVKPSLNKASKLIIEHTDINIFLNKSIIRKYIIKAHFLNNFCSVIISFETINFSEFTIYSEKLINYF